MDKIIIRDLRARGILGINPLERVTPQEILVNVVMQADTRPAGESDNIAHAVNYQLVSDLIIDRIETGADLLVETLAADLARLILQHWPLVQRVMVRVEKPEALPFVRSVGVEIERMRGDFGL